MSDVPTDLLDAASRLMASDGLSALSVRRVAEAAGCSTMAIYSHFGGKSGLFEALARQGFERLVAAQIAAQSAEGGGAYQELHAICRAQQTVARGDPLRYRLMFGAVTELGDEARRAARSSIELVASAIGRAADADDVECDDPAAAAELVFAACHGVISAELAAVLEPDDGRLRAAVEAVLG